VNTTKRWAQCNIDNCTTNDDFRSTPLIVAAFHGQVEVVRVLLVGGANLQGVNKYNYTALHIAAENGRLEVCRLLLDWGAIVDAVGGSWKETALQPAARNGHLSVVQLLVARGADVRLKESNGSTAAHSARNYGRTAVADWLDSVSRV
jgi:ankyrin repeat protein